MVGVFWPTRLAEADASRLRLAERSKQIHLVRTAGPTISSPLRCALLDHGCAITFVPSRPNLSGRPCRKSVILYAAEVGVNPEKEITPGIPIAKTDQPKVPTGRPTS